MKLRRVLSPVLLSAGAAEAATRILTPSGPGRPARVPPALEHFSAEEIARGRRYARGQRLLGLAGGATELAALIWIARRSREPGSVAAGASGAAALALGSSVPSLPFAALSRRRALRVGLATQSWRAWGVDLAKAAAIRTAFAAAGGALVTAAARRWPQRWWAPAAGASVTFGAGLAALAPVVLDPLFNDFTPLPEGEARSDVLLLAAKAGIRVGQVLSVDASRRTTAANAYVTGLGPTKRVVLFDTLLDRYTRDELRLVVAHELAHVKHRDVGRGLAYAAIVAGPSAFAVQRLAGALTPAAGERAVTVPSPAALTLAAGIVSAPAGLLGNRLSRAIERRADDFALRLAGAPLAFISFERRIALQNVADVDPPRWLTALMATHPPTLERIAAAAQFAG